MVAKLERAVEIHTPRLVLRMFKDSDLEDVLAYRSNTEVCRYIGALMSKEEALRHIQTRKQSWSGSEGDTLSLAIELRDAGKVVGEMVMRFVSAAAHQVEIGCALHPEYHVRKLATEASLALIRYAFEEMGMHRIVGICDVDNTPSLHLATGIGFKHEGTLRENAFRHGEWRDEHVLSILDREWNAVRGAFQHFLA